MTASLIRQYLTLVENEDDIVQFFLEVHAEHPLQRPLRESRSRQPLMEGPLADKIKATANAVVQKYHDVQYALLAQATTKAMSMFEQNPKVSGVLGQILKLGKVAMQNRALLSILCGVVGTLIGLAANPAAAQQAAGQVEYLLHGDIDHVIQQLDHAGIHVDVSPHGLEALPADLSPFLKKVTAAMKAIHTYEFTGAKMTSNRELMDYITVEGGVEVAHNRVMEDIRVVTPDGQIVLANIHTEIVDGKMVDDIQNGLKFELDEYWEDIPEQYRDQCDDYVKGLIAPQSPATGLQLMAEVMQANWGKIAAMVAAVVVAKGIQGRAKIRISAQGVQVSGGKPAAKPAAPKQRVEPRFD